MNREEIMHNIQNIFRDIFDDSNLVISESTNPDDIEDWDSLEQVNILLALEKYFNIKINLDEALNLKNVGDMVTLVQRKRN